MDWLYVLEQTTQLLYSLMSKLYTGNESNMNVQETGIVRCSGSEWRYYGYTQLGLLMSRAESISPQKYFFFDGKLLQISNEKSDFLCHEKDLFEQFLVHFPKSLSSRAPR